MAWLDGELKAGRRRGGATLQMRSLRWCSLFKRPAETARSTILEEQTWAGPAPSELWQRLRPLRAPGARPLSKPPLSASLLLRRSLALFFPLLQCRCSCAAESPQSDGCARGSAPAPLPSQPVTLIWTPLPRVASFLPETRTPGPTKGRSRAGRRFLVLPGAAADRCALGGCSSGQPPTPPCISDSRRLRAFRRPRFGRTHHGNGQRGPCSPAGTSRRWPLSSSRAQGRP